MAQKRDQLRTPLMKIICHILFPPEQTGFFEMSRSQTPFARHLHVGIKYKIENEKLSEI